MAETPCNIFKKLSLRRKYERELYDLYTWLETQRYISDTVFVETVQAKMKELARKDQN